MGQYFYLPDLRVPVGFRAGQRPRSRSQADVAAGCAVGTDWVAAWLHVCWIVGWRGCTAGVAVAGRTPGWIGVSAAALLTGLRRRRSSDFRKRRIGAS